MNKSLLINKLSKLKYDSNSNKFNKILNTNLYRINLGLINESDYPILLKEVYNAFLVDYWNSKYSKKPFYKSLKHYLNERTDKNETSVMLSSILTYLLIDIGNGAPQAVFDLDTLLDLIKKLSKSRTKSLDKKIKKEIDDYLVKLGLKYIKTPKVAIFTSDSYLDNYEKYNPDHDKNTDVLNSNNERPTTNDIISTTSVNDTSDTVT